MLESSLDQATNAGHIATQYYTMTICHLDPSGINDINESYE